MQDTETDTNSANNVNLNAVAVTVGVADTTLELPELEVDSVQGAGTCYIGYTVTANGCGSDNAVASGDASGMYGF